MGTLLRRRIILFAGFCVFLFVIFFFFLVFQFCGPILLKTALLLKGSCCFCWNITGFYVHLINRACSCVICVMARLSFIFFSVVQLHRI